MSSEVRLGYRFAAIPEWVVQHPDLDGNAVRVYAVLARFTETFTSLDYVAKRCGGCSEDTVRRAIRRLQSVGAVRVSERFTEEGRQTSNLYELAGDSPLAELPPSQQRDGEGSKSATPVPSKSATRTREPSTQTRGGQLPAAAPQATDSFAVFWELYPRKVGKTGKGGADGAWKAAIKRSPADEIIAGLRLRIEWWKRSRTEARFIPNPSTWLNQSRWLDTLDPIESNGASAAVRDADRAAVMRDEAEEAISRGRPDLAWQIICERAKATGDVTFGRIADMLATHTNITISRVLDCDLGQVVTVRELHRRVHGGEKALVS